MNPSVLKTKPRHHPAPPLESPHPAVRPLRPLFTGKHPVLRGDFPALVFSGDREILGELPSELTASTVFKFALPDVRLPADRDFARTPSMPLPVWPADRILPVAGVCFVVSDRSHPAFRTMLERGGIEHEHITTVDHVLARTDDQMRWAGLRDAMMGVGGNGRVVLLGYGDQGARMAAFLIGCGAVSPGRLAVVDSNAESVRRAQSDGFAVLHEMEIQDAAAIIYTPLMRYESLHGVMERAVLGGRVLTFDNSDDATGIEHFAASGRCMLDAAANRALHVKDAALGLRDHGLPIESVAVVREETRRLGGFELPQITGGHRAVFRAAADVCDLAAVSAADRLSAATFGGLRFAYVSLRDRPDTAIFAARSLCMRLWPEATADVFPARLAADLGRTRLERLIKRHVDGAEIVAASQTSAQQVMLGVLARQYAADSPIVEIGSALGGSGALMAAATERNRPEFFSIDPETATRHIMRFAFEQIEQSDRLHQIVKTSDRAIEELSSLRGKAGLVFIDGLHTEAAATADYINYAPLVRPGGVLLIHDVEPARYGVMRVVLERVLPDGRFVPRCLVDGLLALERKG